MKTTKALFGILAITCLVLTFAGCGKKPEETPSAKQTAPKAQAPPPVQEVKTTEAIATTPVDEKENIALPDNNPTHEHTLTLKEINERILTGDLSPTNTYRYIENVDVPTDSEKPISSIKGIVKILNPSSATFSPSDVVISVLRKQLSSSFDTEDQKTNVEKGCYVVVAQIKNSGDALKLIRVGNHGEVLGESNRSEDALLWRFVILSTADIPEAEQLKPQLHSFFSAGLVIVGIPSAESRLIAIDLKTGKEAWTKKFTAECHNVAFGAGINFNFIEPNYLLVQDSVCFRGFDIMKKGAELPWNVKWNVDSKGSDDFIGADDKFAYLFNADLPAISTLNLNDGTTHDLIIVPPEWRRKGADENGNNKHRDYANWGKGVFDCFFLKPEGDVATIAIDEPETGLALYSSTDGKLLWKKTYKEINSYLANREETIPGSIRMAKCELRGTNVFLEGNYFHSLLSYKTGETISFDTYEP